MSQRDPTPELPKTGPTGSATHSVLSETITLGDIAIGQSAVVLRVACARPTAVRLMEMGLLPGTRVTLSRRAPFGDPLELLINGYALSIRRAEAMLVKVERASTKDAAPSAVSATPSTPHEAHIDDDGAEVT